MVRRKQTVAGQGGIKPLPEVLPSSESSRRRARSNEVRTSSLETHADKKAKSRRSSKPTKSRRGGRGRRKQRGGHEDGSQRHATANGTDESCSNREDDPPPLEKVECDGKDEVIDQSQEAEEDWEDEPDDPDSPEVDDERADDGDWKPESDQEEQEEEEEFDEEDESEEKWTDSAGWRGARRSTRKRKIRRQSLQDLSDSASEWEADPEPEFKPRFGHGKERRKGSNKRTRRGRRAKKVNPTDRGDDDEWAPSDEHDEDDGNDSEEDHEDCAEKVDDASSMQRLSRAERARARAERKAQVFEVWQGIPTQASEGNIEKSSKIDAAGKRSRKRHRRNKVVIDNDEEEEEENVEEKEGGRGGKDEMRLRAHGDVSPQNPLRKKRQRIGRSRVVVSSEDEDDKGDGESDGGGQSREKKETDAGNSSADAAEGNADVKLTKLTGRRSHSETKRNRRRRSRVIIDSDDEGSEESGLSGGKVGGSRDEKNSNPMEKGEDFESHDQGEDGEEAKEPSKNVKKRTRRLSKRVILDSEEEREDGGGESGEGGGKKERKENDINQDEHDFNENDEFHEDNEDSARSPGSSKRERRRLKKSFDRAETPRAKRTRWQLRESRMRTGEKAESEALKALERSRRRRSRLDQMRGKRRREEGGEQESSGSEEEEESGSPDGDDGDDGDDVILMDSVDALHDDGLDEFVVNDEGEDANEGTEAPQEGEEEREELPSSSRDAYPRFKKSKRTIKKKPRWRRRRSKKPAGVNINADGLMELGADYYDSGDDEEGICDGGGGLGLGEDEGEEEGQDGNGFDFERIAVMSQFKRFWTQNSSFFHNGFPGWEDLRNVSQVLLPNLPEDFDATWFARALKTFLNFPIGVRKLISEYCEEMPTSASKLFTELSRCIRRADFSNVNSVPSSRVKSQMLQLIQDQVIGDQTGFKAVYEDCNSRAIENRSLRNLFGDARDLLEARQMGISREREFFNNYIPWDQNRNRHLLWSACQDDIQLTPERFAGQHLMDFQDARDEFFSNHPYVFRSPTKKNNRQPASMEEISKEWRVGVDYHGSDAKKAARHVRLVSKMVWGLTAKLYKVWKEDPDSCDDVLRATAKVVCGVCQKYPRLILHKASIPDYDAIYGTDDRGDGDDDGGHNDDDGEDDDDDGGDDWRSKRTRVRRRSESSEESEGQRDEEEEGGEGSGQGEESDVREETSRERGSSRKSFSVGICCSFKIKLSRDILALLKSLFAYSMGRYAGQDLQNALYLIVSVVITHYSQLAQESKMCM